MQKTRAMAKRIRNKEGSINKALETAFLFHATRPYDKVSLEEMAAHSAMTSGGILYHFKTKNNLFMQMCDKFVLEESSLFNKVEMYEDTTFLEYIDRYISLLDKQRRKAKELGIDNLNRALVNITNQAIFYYPDFIELGNKWVDLQIEEWKKVLIKSMVKRDIRENIDINLAARSFETIYIGLAYASIASEEGLDLPELKKSFIFLYNSLRV